MLNKLSKKTIERLWTASLIVISGILLILFASSLLGLELPILMIRILGVIDLLAIPVLAWTTYRKLKRPSRKSASKSTKD
ncbi:MAG: hypothetical protein IJP32_07015 [Clostridia bacterium]|nr:hypothetical protein [Clostridia bacterium]MBQ9996103.1 hypothetical protein [Clostridia bacterium]